MPGWTHTATTSNSAELTTHGHGASWVTQGRQSGTTQAHISGPHYPWDPILGMGPVAHTLTWLVPPQHMRLPDQRTQVGQSLPRASGFKPLAQVVDSHLKVASERGGRGART